MPILTTKKDKGKELYFDLRPTGQIEEEGFWATPLFFSDRQSIEQAHTARGGSDERLWMELLVHCVKRWVGFKDREGEDIPCTAEYIRDLCDAAPEAMMGMLALVRKSDRTRLEMTSKN